MRALFALWSSSRSCSTPGSRYTNSLDPPWANVLNRRTETLKAALKAVSDAAAQLKDVGFDDLAADLRASISRIRREMNHVEAVQDHPDLFG